MTYGHHPDTDIDYEIEIGRLQGCLCDAQGGLLRALDSKSTTPHGLAVKRDVRTALANSGFKWPATKEGE